MKIPCLSGRSCLVALPGLALTFTPTALHAQTAWDAGGGNTDYSNNLNWAGDIIPGNGNANGALIGSSLNHTVIYNTSTSYTSTGTGTANSLLVGTGTAGVGSLTLSGSAGTLTFGGDGYNSAAQIGSTTGATTASGTVTVSAGKLAITGGINASINLGVHLSGALGGIKSGTLLINGGTVEVGGRILMGANATDAAGTLTLSSGGLLDMKRTGTGLLAAENGTIQLGTGNNTVNLDGGTAILSGFHITGAANARSNIYFNGTTLKANVASTDFFNGTTTNANLILKNGGLVFDTNTFNVTINDALTQQAGQVAILRKEGPGTLTISGAQANRTGTTTVNGGTLLVSGAGSIGTGATTVSGSGSILNLARNDTWGNHSGSAQALTIQSGGLVTNGTAINSGYNTVQTLALDGGELRVTGTARAVTDGVTGLFKFEAYGIRDTVTVTGSVASSITNPGAITNAGINIGGVTNLSAVTFNVADVTSSPAADLTVSAVLKNNYDSTGSLVPLSNGLVKTGGGTMVLSAVNRYTGATTVTTGTLQVDGSTAAGSTVGIGTAGTLSGSGTVNGNATLTGGGIINKSAGAIAGTLGVTGGFWNGAGSVTGAVTSSSGTFTIASGANLTATSGVSATGGALVVNGTLTGTLNTNSSTTVSGTGTITGNTTISGIHSPGNSPGVQSYGSSLSYTTSASVTWELVSDAIGTRGTNFDGINVGSTLDFTGTTTLNLVFNFAGSTVDWADTFWDTSHTGTSGWLVYDVATNTTNFDNLSVTAANWLDGSGAQFNTFNSGNTFSLFKDGNDIYLNYNAVPEPNVAALLGGFGVLALLARRRK